MADNYDMVVIGAGPGGYVAAIRGAQLGLKVAIIERDELGGICLNWGCIPTKALLRSAEVFHLMKRATEFGLKADKIAFDLKAMVARSRKVAGQLNSGVAHLLKKNKITVIIGDASLSDQNHIAIKTDAGPRELIAKNIVLATGARARELPNLKGDGDLIWHYKDALEPKRMPKALLVVGSGAIGIEFASFFNTLGAKTTVIEVQDRILISEDAEISALAQKQFEQQGMTILTNTTLKQLVPNGQGATAHLATAGKPVQTQQFDTVISAVGIIANSKGLGLERLGIALDTGGHHVKTDDYGHTGVGNIYAIGDLTAGPWLAHKASHEGVMVAERIAGRTPHAIDKTRIAGCIYSHPQIASVGLSEAEAKAQGYTVKIGRFPFIGNGKAIALGEVDGMVKTIFDAKTDALLGAHMIGAEVTELIQGYITAQNLETTEAELIATIFPHPTLSEMMHESVLDAYGRAIHF